MNEEDHKSITLQTYDLPIAHIDKNTGWLTLYGSNWNRSKRTRRHLKRFINGYTDFNYVSVRQWVENIVTNSKIRIEI